VQSFGQRTVPPTTASLIYATDPLFAAGFSYLLLGERLGGWGFVGGLMIVGAAVGGALGSLVKKE